MKAQQPDEEVFSTSGKILYLTENPAWIRRQLGGEALAWPVEVPLMAGLSTDAIIPVDAMVDFGDRLGERVYTGIHGSADASGAGRGPAPVVDPGVVRAGGFSVSVSGPRRGRGSSREHAPWAERCAGIRLIVAASFEHIYRQNCHNLGILTSTDYGVLERLARAEPIPLAELTRDLDPVEAEVVRHGGLLAWSRARTQEARPKTKARAWVPSRVDGAIGQRPLTLGEKILTRHNLTDRAATPGSTLFVEADLRVSHEYITPMAAHYFRTQMPPGASISDPSSVLLFRDHLTFVDAAIEAQGRPRTQRTAAARLAQLQAEFAREQGVRLIGEQQDRKGSLAVSHNRLLEEHAIPGQLVISADSHAPTLGAMGTLAIGVGASALASSWISKGLHIRVPPSVRIQLTGSLTPGVCAKDVALRLLCDPLVGAGKLAGRLIEWSGPGVAGLDIDERATLTNMAADLGAFSSLVAPGAAAVRRLVERGVPVAQAEAWCDIAADPGAEYERVVELDLGTVGPMVALPGDPGNGRRLDTVDKIVPIDIAFGGSCTGNKSADMEMYARVLRHALDAGRRVHPGVAFYIQVGSVAVREHCRRRGHLEVFARAGAIVLEPGCGACCNAGPGVSTRPEQVTISAANRNYPGRNGPGRVYLGSPYTVAASAVAGRLAAFVPSATEQP